MYADIYVKKPTDIPLVEHYAVFKGGSIYIPGDERSRTNPGHGYPESTENVIQYEVFQSKEALEAYITSSDPLQARHWKIAKITPMTLALSIEVK